MLTRQLHWCTARTAHITRCIVVVTYGDRRIASRRRSDGRRNGRYIGTSVASWRYGTLPGQGGGGGGNGAAHGCLVAHNRMTKKIYVAGTRCESLRGVFAHKRGANRNRRRTDGKNIEMRRRQTTASTTPHVARTNEDGQTSTIHLEPIHLLVFALIHPSVDVGVHCSYFTTQLNIPYTQ